MDQKECFRNQHARINQHRLKEKRQIKEAILYQSLNMREAIQDVREKCRRSISGNRIGSAIQGNCSNKAKVIFPVRNYDHIQNRQKTRLENKKIPQY